MGIQYVDDTWLIRRPADEPGPAGATAADRPGHLTYIAAAATLVAALAVMAAPVLVATLSIAVILK